MSAIDAIAEQLYEKLGRGSQADTKTLSQALLAAEKRGREEAAKIAASFGTEERRGERHGETSLDADIIAAAIRSGQ